VLLVTAVREKSERNHPVVLVLDTDRLDVDTVKVPLRFWGRRVFTRNTDIIGDIGIFSENEPGKVHGVETN
jgi:hypothetical protein